MDVVVADIAPKYGMLLSRSWGAKLQGSLQLDLSYATISVFGKPKRLYRETLMKYVVKKDAKVRWSLETKQAFEGIISALTQAPVLTSPQFDKDFIIFSFASNHTIVVVLLQKDDQGAKKPIAFFSRALRDALLKYPIMEKQAYALVKAIKYF